MGLPMVAIVGRVNVGKSSLFNRLVGRRLAIEAPEPGVTRDRVSAVCDFCGRPAELVDTGGAMNSADFYATEIDRQIDAALREASLAILVVDARAGCLPADALLAEKLRRLGSPVLLAANKVDTDREEALASDFARLGFETCAVSATSARGVADLVVRLADRLGKAEPRKSAHPSLRIRIAIAGRPNAGKSTWVNTCLGAERMIVSERPGTTRDAVDVAVERNRRAFVLVDTAGLRKKRSVQGVDFYAQERAEAAIRSADAVLLLLEAPRPLGQVDKSIAAAIARSGKPAVLVVNKWDLAPQEKRDAFVRYLGRGLPELSGSPVAFASALEGTGVWETLELAWELGRRAALWEDPARLAAAVSEAVGRNPPCARRKRGARGRSPEILEVRQVGVSPVRVQIRTGEPALWRPADRRMLASAIRSRTAWSEIPIQLVFVAGRPREAGRRERR